MFLQETSWSWTGFKGTYLVIHHHPNPLHVLIQNNDGMGFCIFTPHSWPTRKAVGKNRYSWCLITTIAIGLPSTLAEHSFDVLHFINSKQLYRYLEMSRDIYRNIQDIYFLLIHYLNLFEVHNLLYRGLNCSKKMANWCNKINITLFFAYMKH